MIDFSIKFKVKLTVTKDLIKAMTITQCECKFPCHCA